MGEGFDVDLGALRQAADGIRRATEGADRTVDPAPGADVLGHDGLADATAEFLDRWQRGVQDLVDDGRAAGEQLRVAADAYERADATGARSLGGVMRADFGPDPAAPR